MEKLEKIKKSILVIAAGNYISGAEKVTLDVLEGLKKNGYNLFCIMSGWTDGDFGRRLTEMNIGFKLIKLGWYYVSNIRWSIDSLINYPKAIKQFYQFMKINKYDIVYTISYRPVVLLYPFLEKNIVYHVHDPNSHSKQSKFFLRLIDNKVIKYIAVSHFIKNDLIRCGIDESKIEVVHNGTNIIEDVGLPIRKDSSALVVGIAGQVIKRKGHEDLIEALKILRDKTYNIRVIIIGKGDIKFIEELKRLIEKYHLTGFVEWRNFKESVRDIFDGVDVVVAPTRNHEPFGLVPIEANMLSLPVIVTNRGGYVETVVSGHNGYLVDAYNPEQIATHISLFYTNRELINQLGYNGRINVLENFTKDRMINEVIQIIDGI